MTKIRWRSFGHDFANQWSQPQEDSDYAAILVLHAKMCERVGRTFDLPHPGKRPTMICMVGEKEGRITNFILGEAEMEISAGGEEPLHPAQFAAVAHEFRKVARFYQIRMVRAFVPKTLLTKPNGKRASIKRLLESSTLGFTQDSDDLAPFFHWVEPEDKGKVV